MTEPQPQFAEVKDLSRVFGAIHAVEGVSFGINRGEVYGFIGPNGAGKSTTMRLLAGLDVPTGGECFVDGYCTIADPEEIYRLVGYMPDAYGAYPLMSVVEYLDFFARAYGLRGAARQRSLRNVIEFCKLGDLRDKLVNTLSKGMKQRLCLGRCLIHDPALLILDEPAAGLDPRARIELRELLQLLAQQGKAVFISSHILADLEEICHGVAIIEAGQLVASGSVAAVKEKAAVARDARRASGDAAHAVLEIGLSEPFDQLKSLLLEQPELFDVSIAHRSAVARVHGDATARAALLRRLVTAGVPICRFDVRQENLEDLFLDLTHGKVQ